MILPVLRKAVLPAFFCVLVSSLLAQPGGPSIAELIQAAKSGSDAARIKAIDALGAKGEKAAEAVGSLVPLLADRAPGIRAHAAHALGEIRTKEKSAVEALTALVKDADEAVRQQAVRAITNIRPGPQVMIPLFIQLMDDPDPAVRGRILQAVANAGPVAVPSLIEALDHEKAAYWACIILRDMGPEASAAVPALTAKLKDARLEVRREAALALGAMQAAAAPAASQLVALLDDENTQIAATFALGQIGQIPAAADAKVRANAKGNNKLLSTMSLWALARVHPDDKALAREAAQQIVGRLQDSDPYVRVGAARALAALKLDPEISFPIFEKVLATADAETTRHAMDALAALGPQAVPRLTEALKHESLQAHAAYILGQIGPPAAPATGALAKLVDNKNSRIGSEAALALAKIGPAAKASVPALTAALQQPHCPNAHAIIYALGKIGPDAAAAKPLLVSQIKSEPSLAVISAWAITQVDPRSGEASSIALPALIAGLSDASPAARQLAAHSLGTASSLPKEALAALEKAAQDSDPTVRETAAEALRAVRDRGAK